MNAALSFFNPKRWGIISEIFEVTRFDSPISVSYSQAAEDLVLMYFLEKSEGFYIDIGAHHPNRFSVTRQLYAKGWSGINVDANPNLRKSFEDWRPRDTFLNLAVGSQDEYVFTIFSESAMSTTNLAWKEKFIRGGVEVIEEISVPGITMKDLFDLTPSNKELDLVNLDIEGGDVEAISSLRINNQLPKKMPTWFLCETPSSVSKALESESVKLLKLLGYEPWAVLPFSTLLRRVAISN